MGIIKQGWHSKTQPGVMSPKDIAKRAAYRYLDGQKDLIRRDKPFKLSFNCAGYQWTAYAPEVVTTPEGKTFVISHQLVGEILE